MNAPTERQTDTSTKQGWEAAGSAGRAAGYCWVRNPRARGRCTRRPDHSDSHKDYYANAEWR